MRASGKGNNVMYVFDSIRSRVEPGGRNLRAGLTGGPAPAPRAPPIICSARRRAATAHCDSGTRRRRNVTRPVPSAHDQLSRTNTAPQAKRAL